ncbi:diaminopropionate ammonia-lyase [Phenylobacterium sp.]|uniref:diaminopropionate ammonia-lyase n=1 Tax=Phenylobacterium sp. TaxID=1871053 RepID=UPI002FC710F0
MIANPSADAGSYGEAERVGFDPSTAEIARAELKGWRDYAVTPLVELPVLADRLGVRQVAVKDEGARTDLGSFKALGGAYAICQHLRSYVEQGAGVAHVSADDLENGLYSDLTQAVVATCASDGNHGRSVAWGARRFGCGCVVYLPRSVSSRRAEAIEAYGAQVVWVDGNYDDAVRLAAEDAQRLGRTVIADTSSPAYQAVPRQVMAGYSLLFEEALDQLERAPSHVFVQVGCGALAAVAAGYLWARLGFERPKIIAVEPVNAACLLETVREGELAIVGGEHETIMGGLACGEVSYIAWQVLRRGLDYALAMPDEFALQAMVALADGSLGHRLTAGETGAAGVGALLALAQDASTRQALGLTDESRVLLVITEGATDPDLYARLLAAGALQ